jgi:hypothetical protein
MTDLYLKFADQAQADSVLYTVTDEVTDADGVVVQEASSKPNFANIDVIGTISKPTGAMTTSEDGMEVPVMAELDGYHVNVRVVGSEDASALVPFSVVPTVPVRIWG